MQIHMHEFPEAGSDEMVRIRREWRSIKVWIQGETPELSPQFNIFASPVRRNSGPD
jgi:hypothetical protein